ncbi:glycosylase [bacterium]|nr:glycosylase [bacterium]
MKTRVRQLWIATVALIGVFTLNIESFASDLFPPELVNWTPLTEQPVFTGAGEGHWDVKIRERGYILKEGDQWRMWYTGYDGTREGQKFLGLATSTDGIHWTRFPQNPIYREHWVEDVCVVKHGDGYVMVCEGLHDQAQMLTSPDGISWTRTGTLDVRLANGAPIPPGPYGTPTLWIEGDTWYLFYERRDLGIWLATSKDQKVWLNVQDEPVLSPGPELYDRDMIALNQILKYQGRYYAVFHGAPNEPQPRLWSTGLATSADLVHWEKYRGNPLRPMIENKSSGQLVPMDKGFRLYTMHDRVEVHGPVK